jgi:hypothetical protein
MSRVEGPVALTPKQRRLRKEIEDIASMVDTDHWNILDYKPSVRTSRLEATKNRLIRGHIIAMYTFVDQLLTLAIWRYYFYESSKKRPLTQRWRTKKFRTFHHLLEATSLLRKLEVVSAIRQVPKQVSSAISRINDVRNALAHVFYPEKGRSYWKHKKVMYHGADLFSKEGVEKFMQDCQLVEEYLWRRVFGQRGANSKPVLVASALKPSPRR